MLRIVPTFPRRLAGAAGAMTLLVGGPLATTAVATPSSPSVAPTVHVFATGTSKVYGPDDITSLAGAIFVTWQNGVGPAGSPSPTGALDSTVIEYTTTGTEVAQWSLKGHVDGLTADPAASDVLATSNEDGNSSPYTISPSVAKPDQVHHYQYSPTPLPHGGGTDAVSIYHGQILISASAPTNPAGPAVYRATLTGGKADLQPVFFDNSAATVANAGPDQGTAVTLALTDPDSNEVVPATSNRFGGDFMLDSQGDEQQIYVTGADGPRPQLRVLDLTQSVDDTAFPTNSTGTLYVTDGADNEIFAVTGGFVPGTAVVAVTPGDANTPVDAPNYLGHLDLRTGTVTPFVATIQAKGLLFLP